MAIITSKVEVGYEAVGSTKTPTSYRTWLFSGGWPRKEGWPAKNVHTDLEFARASGLATRNASGAMAEGYIAELMVDLFGEEWLCRGTVELKFVRPVDPGDRVTARATVTANRREGSRTGIDLAVRCDNQHGDAVVIGTATGWLERDDGAST